MPSSALMLRQRLDNTLGDVLEKAYLEEMSYQRSTQPRSIARMQQEAVTYSRTVRFHEFAVARLGPKCLLSNRNQIAVPLHPRPAKRTSGSKLSSSGPMRWPQGRKSRVRGRQKFLVGTGGRMRCPFARSSGCIHQRGLLCSYLRIQIPHRLAA